MRHRELPVEAVQFHRIDSDRGGDHGLKLMANAMRLAKAAAPAQVPNVER